MDSPTAVNDSSLSQLEQNFRALRKSFESFCAQLDPFPHSFQLQNQENLQSDQLHRVKGALESALDVGYPTPLETARARNLLAYVYCQLGRCAEALSQAEKVATLDGQHQNLVTIANKAVILWHLQQRTLAQNEVQTLMGMKGLPAFPYLLVKAKAELAFSYTRFDPSFYPLAQTAFDEVIPQAQEPELWLWKFGLALTRRRILRPSVIKGSNDGGNYRSVLRLFLDIIKCCASNSLKAKVYAEMALLLFMPTSEDLREILEKQAGMSVLEACSSALKCDDNDHSVLWKCGKLYRYKRKTELSLDILKKAVTVRETSKGYHHLGLTYEALAKAEKLKTDQAAQPQSEENTNIKTDHVSEGYFQQFQAQLSRSASCESQSHSDHAPLARQSSESQHDKRLLEGNACARDDKQPLSTLPPATSYHTADKSTKETFEIWKIVKSPLGGTALFNKEDLYVAETVDALSMAVTISKWENAEAIYQLALFLRSMGELEDARYYLERGLSKEHTLRIFTKINVCEQLGLIFADMARTNASEEESKRLTEKSHSMLLMALKTASERYCKAPADSRQVRDIWHSFPALLETVDKNEKSSEGKLHDKARLFRLIRANEESLAILQDLRKMDPQKGNDPEHLKLCIENYVEMQKFEDALVFVDLLQCTSQHDKTMELFEDPQFLHKVYLQAAKKSLQRGSQNFKSHFTAAFACVDQRGNLCSSSEDTNSEGERESKPRWDVHLVHEDTEEDTDMAMGLVSTLTDLCGLRVTRMDDDVMGGFRLDGVYDVMRRSRVVVMMVRGGQKPSSELRYFINMAARRPSSVSLLVHGGRPPKVLSGHCSMELPSDLQVTATLDPGALSPQGVEAVCGLFGFLAGIHITQ